MNDPYGLAASGLPPEMVAELSGLTRKQAIAEALFKQSQGELQAPEVKGRFQGRVSPLQGIAKVMQAYMGMQGMSGAQEGMGGLAARRDEMAAKAMADYQQQRTGAPEKTIPYVTGLTADDEGNAMPPAIQPATPGDPRAAIMKAMMNPLIAKNPMIGMDAKALQPTQVGRSLMIPGTGETVATDPAVAQEREALTAAAKEKQAAEQAFREQQAKQAAEERKAREAQAAADREVQIRLAASLRPPSPPEALEAVQGEDGKAVLVPRSEAIGKTPTSRSTAERNIPAPVLQAMATNDGNVRRAQMIVDLLEGKDVKMPTPDGKEVVLKGDKNATGAKNYLPDAFIQRTDKKGIDTRAVIGDLGSMVIHDRSGAAVTASEFPRLRPFIPLSTDAPDVALKKAKRFVAEYSAINGELKGMFNEDQGYRVPQRRASDKAGTTFKFDGSGNPI